MNASELAYMKGQIENKLEEVFKKNDYDPTKIGCSLLKARGHKVEEHLKDGMGMSPFKKLLKEAVHLYFDATWSYDAFVKAQRLESELLTARNDGTVTYDEYKALYPLVAHLIAEMRETLNKSQEVSKDEKA